MKFGIILTIQTYFPSLYTLGLKNIRYCDGKSSWLQNCSVPHVTMREANKTERGTDREAVNPQAQIASCLRLGFSPWGLGGLKPRYWSSSNHRSSWQASVDPWNTAQSWESSAKVGRLGAWRYIEYCENLPYPFHLGPGWRHFYALVKQLPLHHPPSRLPARGMNGGHPLSQNDQEIDGCKNHCETERPFHWRLAFF